MVSELAVLGSAPALDLGTFLSLPDVLVWESEDVTEEDAWRQLAPVLEALSTARKARSLALQNFGVAFLYNIVAVPFAVAGFVTPLIAAIVMSTSSILVTVNAARLAGGSKP